MSNESVVGPDAGSIAWHVSLAGRALSARIETGLVAHGIGRGEYRVLFALYEQEGLSQSDLVRRHHLDKGVIARVVGRLGEKGYLERRTDPDDKRRKLLYLTDEAERLRSEVADCKETIDGEITAGLTDDEIETLIMHLRVVSENLGIDLGGEY